MTKKRLIDADELKAKLNTAVKNAVEDHCEYACAFKNAAQEWSAELWAIEDTIDDMPTVDAVPVKHGYWIEEIDPEEDCWNEEVLYCSCCDEPIRVHETDNTYFLPTRRTLKYCPNCGAKMDAERKEE